LRIEGSKRMEEPSQIKTFWRFMRQGERQSFFIGEHLATVSDGSRFIVFPWSQVRPTRATQFSLKDVVAVSCGVWFRRENVALLAAFGIALIVGLFLFELNWLKGTNVFLQAGIILLLGIFLMFGLRGRLSLVVVQLRHGELRFELSHEVSRDFAKAIFRKLAELRNDEPSRQAAVLFADSHYTDMLLADAFSENDGLDLLRIGLAKENGINCKKDFKAAIQAYQKSFSLLPTPLPLAGFARMSLNLPDELELIYPHEHIFDSYRDAIKLMRASVYADKVVWLDEEDALCLSFSGGPNSTLSLLALKELNDGQAHQLAGSYEGRTIRLNSETKISDNARKILGRLVEWVDS
jgi:hypothetical protein